MMHLSSTGQQQYPNSGPPPGSMPMKNQPVSFNQPPYGGGPQYNFQQQMRPNINQNQYRQLPQQGMPQMQQQQPQGMAQMQQQPPQGMAQMQQQPPQGMAQMQQQPPQGMAQMQQQPSQGMAQMQQQPPQGMAQMQQQPPQGMAQMQQQQQQPPAMRQPMSPQQPAQQVMPPMAPLQAQPSMTKSAGMVQKPPVSPNIPPLAGPSPKTVGEQCPTYRYTVDNNFVEFHTVPGNCKM